MRLLTLSIALWINISSADYEQHATAEIEVLSWIFYFNLHANISSFLFEEDQISVV